MQQFYVWKLFDRVLAPFEQSYVELAAFLGLCLLATAALVVRRHRQVWRFVVQMISLIVFFLVVSSCLGVFGLIRNAFLGLKLLSQQDDLSGFYWLSMTVVALGATFVGGAIFCGWICPTGTLQEWAAWLARRFRGTDGQSVPPTGGHRSSRRAAIILWVVLIVAYLTVAYRVFSGRRPILEDSATLWAGSLSVVVAIVLLTPRHSAALKRFRTVSLLLILGFTVAGISVFSPVHFIFMNVQDWASLLSAIVIVGAAIFVARAWCRYLCPFGLICGWAARRAIFQIEKSGTCTSCGVCSRVCEVEAVADGKIDVLSCIACMKCVDHCPEQALALVARPFDKGGQASRTGCRPALLQSAGRAAVRSGAISALLCIAATATNAATVDIQWNGFRGDPGAMAWRHFEVGQIGKLSSSGVDRLTTYPTTEIPATWTFRGANVVWNYTPGISVWSSPAVAQIGNRVVCFVGSYDHNVYALDVATGHELWRYPTGNGVYSTPAVVRLNGRDCVLVASSDRTIYCLNAEKGIKLWSYEVYEWRQSLGRAFLSSPIVLSGGSGPSVILAAWVYDTAPKQATERADVLAIAPENGTARLLWRRTFAQSRPTHPVVGEVGGQTRIYVGCRDGNLYCLDGRDGSEIWRRTSRFPIVGTPAVVGQAGNLSHPSLVLVGSEFGDIRAFDGDSGDPVWSFKTGHWVQATPAIVAGPDGTNLALIGSCDGSVYCLNARTGQARWHYHTSGNIVASAAIVPRDRGFEVFVPSDDDMLHAIDGRNGRGIWQFSPGPFLWAYRGLGDTIWESPVAVRIGEVDMLIVPFYDGRIHAYRLDRSREWLPRTGDPAYGRAMLARIGASMIGTLLVALAFIGVGTKRARRAANRLQLRTMNEER